MVTTTTCTGKAEGFPDFCSFLGFVLPVLLKRAVGHGKQDLEPPAAPGSGCGEPEVLELVHGRDEPGARAHTAQWICCGPATPSQTCLENKNKSSILLLLFHRALLHLRKKDFVKIRRKTQHRKNNGNKAQLNK